MKQQLRNGVRDRKTTVKAAKQRCNYQILGGWEIKTKINIQSLKLKTKPCCSFKHSSFVICMNKLSL